MLVFVSDLHLGDRTTGVQFLEIGAFAETLPGIARQAREADAREVIFVFLGDIFDMVRTTFWTVPGQQQAFREAQGATEYLDRLVTPWDAGVDYADLQQAAQCLLLHIVERNPAVFDLWSQKLVGRRFTRSARGETELLPLGAEEGELIWPFDREPRRVYVPGNHDRIINQFPGLRAQVIRALGLNLGTPKTQSLPADGSVPFANFYHNAEYQAFARHGHEWDRFNFEHANRWHELAYRPTQADYLDIPIGELIAAEFSRLPSVVSAKLKERWDDKTDDANTRRGWESERARIAEQLNVLDDVRPVAAVVPWLFDSLNTNPVLRPYIADLLEVLLEAFSDSATRLENVPYFQHWLRRHNQPLLIDETEGVRLLVQALQAMRALERGASRLRLNLFAGIRGIAQKAVGEIQSHPGDNYTSEALADLRRVRSEGGTLANTLYILYGHTHHADQMPLTVPGAMPPPSQTAERPREPAVESLRVPTCAVYLNTGTWRPLSRQTRNQDGFMRWKNLTYTLLYSYAHDLNSQAEPGAATFETWTGSLLAPLH